MEKGKKVGLSPLNWVLCIAGILFFMSFIALPPMFRAFIPESDNLVNNGSDNNHNNNPIETNKPIVIQTTICTKGETTSEEYQIISEDNKTKLIAYTNESDYNGFDLFSSSCEDESSNFVNVDGLYNGCEIKDNKKIVTHRITLGEYKGGSTIFPFDYKLSSQEIENYLVSIGFSCSKTTNER